MLIVVLPTSRGLLTPQQHYDWGLRALKTVLKGCGNLLRIAKCNMSDEEKQNNFDEKFEIHLVVQALRLNTMSKLTFSDCKRFDSLIQDVFCDVDLKDVGYEELRAAAEETVTSMGLVINDSQVSQIFPICVQTIFFFF